MANSDLSLAERPMLVFRIGTYGSAPKGLDAALALEFADAGDAVVRLSRSELAAQARADRKSKGITTKIGSGVIRGLVYAQALPLLGQGNDVIVDVCFNSERARKRTPLEIAQQTGAVAVALNLTTPLDSIMIRIDKWRAKNGRGRDFDMEGYRLIVPASLDEGMDFVFNVDASGDDVDLLAEQIGNLFEEAGLFAPMTASP